MSDAFIIDAVRVPRSIGKQGSDMGRTAALDGFAGVLKRVVRDLGIDRGTIKLNGGAHMTP